MTRVAVMGAGSWGTTFAMMCTDAGADTVLWARRGEVADEIASDHRNEAYLPGVLLPDLLRATADAQMALDGAEVVVLAVPSLGLPAQLAKWGSSIAPGATLASLIKGVDVDTLRTGSQMIEEELDREPDSVVVVSGPNIAKECASRLPAATVAASPDDAHATRVLAAAMTPYFRVYTNPDKAGVEVGGAVKNVLAIAAGMADGMGFGHNTKAMLVTRGLAEMTRLGVAMGGKALTYLGLAGVGDLVVTCSSPNSRNRTVGERLGKGETIDEIVGHMSMVAEGVKSSSAIMALAQKAGVEMPICEAVTSVVHDGKDPQVALKELMTREAKPELHGLPTE